jgi:5-methylcytosine-specific restriction protein A
MNVWLNDVFTALERLGKPSRLGEIYDAVRELRASRGYAIPKHTEEAVRRTLQQFSSDTTSFKGREDVFTSSMGLGEGVWALRPGAALQTITKHGFIVGEQYSRRDDIHHPFGGSQQSGISASKNSPFIFLFTGSGDRYGYRDHWENGFYNFFGEGQTGDMVFAKGNRAIRDHALLAKDLLLFESLGKGKPVRFLGEFVCESYEEVTAKDREQHDRKAFVFHLQRAEEVPNDIQVPPATLELSLNELRIRAYATAAPMQKTVVRTVYARERKANVKAYALKRAAGICECCGTPAPFNDANGQPFLEVHHIHKLADNGLDMPDNVAAITPNCHRKIHYGADGAAIDQRLAVIIAKKEQDRKPAELLE